MGQGNRELSLGEAAGLFLSSLSPEDRADAQQEMNRLVRWFGGTRPLADLTGYEVAEYAEQLSPSAPDYVRKVELVRAFLAQARKRGWCGVNLAAHLKVRKGKTALVPPSRRNLPRRLSVTQQGYDELQAELDGLKQRRLEVIDEMRRAAEDKDFRENAPLQAAREERGHLEGRIIELEEAIKAADIIGEEREEKLKVTVGDSIVLYDMDSGEDLRYTIVSPREAAPAEGKISDASPVGRAVVGRSKGEVVEVVTPTGKLRCQIKQVF